METSLLIAARVEYTNQLQEMIYETIYCGIKKTWESCKENENPLKCFQNKLCLIPEWNQEVISSYYKKILSPELSAEYLDKIIEAVFLSNIKILSVVKLQNKKQVININVPDTKNFIHKCFIESARQFYSDPHLMDDRDYYNSGEIVRNVKRSYKIILESIEKTIRSMIPMEEILNKYLDSQEEDVKIISESDHESDQEQVAENPIKSDSEPEPEPQPEPEPLTNYNQQPETISGDMDLFLDEPETNNTQDPEDNQPQLPGIRIGLGDDKTPNENFFTDSD
jgi:hypothetical protein